MNEQIQNLGALNTRHVSRVGTIASQVFFVDHRSCNISKLRQPNFPRKFFVFSSIRTSAANHSLGETNRMIPQNIWQVKYDNPGLVSRNTDKSWRVSSHIFQIYFVVTLAICMLNSLFLRFRVLLS